MPTKDCVNVKRFAGLLTGLDGLCEEWIWLPCRLCSSFGWVVLTVVWLWQSAGRLSDLMWRTGPKQEDLHLVSPWFLPPPFLHPFIHPSPRFLFFLTYFLFSGSLWLCSVPHFFIKTCSRQCYRWCLICKLWAPSTGIDDRWQAGVGITGKSAFHYQLNIF